jgi:transglutaminase-like putative cysteine protease
VTNHPADPRLREYLRSTCVIDSDNPTIGEFAHATTATATTAVDRAVALYYAVRDGVRYDPYSVDLTPDGMRASTTLARRAGFCISKAVLLAACARATLIPSRIGFADVKNHLATSRLLHLMQTDLFVFHGYTELHINGTWVKATPAFNESLCRRLQVEPLEFDGCTNSVFEPFDTAGRKSIQYVRDHGVYADVPLPEIRRAFEKHYPSLMSEGVYRIQGRFEDDLDTAQGK